MLLRLDEVSLLRNEVEGSCGREISKSALCLLGCCATLSFGGVCASEGGAPPHYRAELAYQVRFAIPL